MVPLFRWTKSERRKWRKTFLIMFLNPPETTKAQLMKSFRSIPFRQSEGGRKKSKSSFKPDGRIGISTIRVRAISKRKFALIIFIVDSASMKKWIVIHMCRRTHFWITRRGRPVKKLSATVKNPFRFYLFDVFIFLGSGSIKRASVQCQRTKTKVEQKIYRLTAEKNDSIIILGEKK